MRLLVALAFVVLSVLPARAETIRITSGAFDWSGLAAAGDLSLSGADFSFTGRTSTSGILMPYQQCHVPECLPGTTVDLRGFWVGLDVTGTANVDGTSIRVGSLDLSFGSLSTEFTGSLTIPAGFTSGVVTAPFFFTGRFGYPAGTPGFQNVLDLFGGGTATLTFAPYQAYPGALLLTDLRYEFDPDAAPTPEPASMLLIGTGLAGVLAVRRRRRAQA